MVHTQGPWSVKRNQSHPWIVECETNVPGHKGTVATVGYRLNAHLIAAAPELLEACKEALRIVNEKQYSGSVDLFKAVISKAEGGLK